MRFPTLEQDGWELSSAERLHAEHPNTFWIPPRADRDNIRRGQAAKLIFEIAIEEAGARVIQGERIFVIVQRKVGQTYFGILDDQPASIAIGSDAYLCFGAEIPFRAEHVTQIADPPPEYVNWQLSQPPERVWETDGT